MQENVADITRRVEIRRAANERYLEALGVVGEPSPIPSRAHSRRRASGRTTRLLRLHRAHGLLRKVSHTFNSRITNKGQRLMTTALKLRKTSFHGFVIQSLFLGSCQRESYGQAARLSSLEARSIRCAWYRRAACTYVRREGGDGNGDRYILCGRRGSLGYERWARQGLGTFLCKA